MATGETIFRSALDKPLDQLTEEDILQLTREDCRKYLKEKGMRRPSWNKSQAIQQVISLKSLLETKTNSGGEASIRQKISVPQPRNPPSAPSISAVSASVKVTNADLETAVSADESISYRRKDPPKPLSTGDVSCRPPVTDNVNVTPRTTGVTEVPSSQMTIFYCGKVNVYDDVPADKARAIMQLTAGPIYSPQDTPFGGSAAVQPFPCRLQTAFVRPSPSSPPAAISPTVYPVKFTNNPRQQLEDGNSSREIEPDGPTSRKASLQRYREKRKDRFKNKKKIVGSSSSSFEMYFNHQVRSQIPNEQSSQSGTGSPPQLRPPHIPTQCSSVENEVKNIGFSVDLNDNDIEEG